MTVVSDINMLQNDLGIKFARHSCSDALRPNKDVKIRHIIMLRCRNIINRCIMLFSVGTYIMSYVL